MTSWRLLADNFGFSGKVLSATIGTAAVLVHLVLGFTNIRQVSAQSSVTDWQTAAGGKMAFDVASVKPNVAEPSASTVHENIPLGPQDLFAPTGGLLSATNVSFVRYMIFAYKLSPTQIQVVRSQLPKWANNNRYDINARASGNPTKDQFRLMMQTLLADRFKLAVHYETRQLPVYALVLDNVGKLGPQLKPHPEDSPCPTLAPPGDSLAPTVTGGFPEPCGALTDVQPSAPGRLRGGARNMSMAVIANSLQALASYGNSVSLDRPIFDKTGLTGKFDFVMEWTPQMDGLRPPSATFQPDPTGPTFIEALKEQLGLKLVPQTGPVDVLVIDHVEEPSKN